jgi:xylulokinase
MGIPVGLLRVGNDNLFQSAIFSNTISTLIGAKIEVISTTGAVGAAKAAGVAVGIFHSVEEAMANVEVVRQYEPDPSKEAYQVAFERWRLMLK